MRHFEIQLPEFDALLFAKACGADELSPKLCERGRHWWEELIPLLECVEIYVEGTGYMAAWLNRKAESLADKVYTDSPTEGLLIGAAAYSLLSSVMDALLPHLTGKECLPLPVPPPELQAKLATVGFSFAPEGTPGRRFALLTFSSEAHCSDCRLVNGCPRITRKHPY